MSEVANLPDAPPCGRAPRSAVAIPVEIPVAIRKAALAVLMGLLSACAGGVPQQIEVEPLSENEVETYARRLLEDARALRDEGRLDSAARVALRGISLEPDNVELQRLRAEVLEALGRDEEARAHRRIADALDPPPPPPPDQPLALPPAVRVVELIPPPTDRDIGERVPRDWPDGPVAARVEGRLRIRLPEAVVRHVDRSQPASVVAARDELSERGASAALSLQLERAFCAQSVKDGRFALVWLRVAAATPGAADPPQTRLLKTSYPRPPNDEGCRERAVSRALEEALRLPFVVDALAHTDPSGDWSHPAIRALHPQLGERIDAELDAGRAQLRVGDTESALAHFRSAAEMDPQDVDVRALLDDAETHLALAAELAHVSAHTAGGPGALGPDAVAAADGWVPGLTSADRARLEQRLEDERLRREELLAVLAALDEDREAPSPDSLAVLRPVEITDATAVGPSLAREQAGGSARITARALYAHDGSVIARYYFAGDAEDPLLREDDVDGDGRPDRWVAYEEGARRRVWEDRRGLGRPDLQLVFAVGGDPLERLELDSNGDGRADRSFRYEGGRIHAEHRDTNGDGQHDLFEHFDIDGALALREEDVNGDGNVDVRTAYRSGRIVRREIVNPDVVTGIP